MWMCDFSQLRLTSQRITKYPWQEERGKEEEEEKVDHRTSQIVHWKVVTSCRETFFLFFLFSSSFSLEERIVEKSEELSHTCFQGGRNWVKGWHVMHVHLIIEEWRGRRRWFCATIVTPLTDFKCYKCICLHFFFLSTSSSYSWSFYAFSWSFTSELTSTEFSLGSKYP